MHMNAEAQQRDVEKSEMDAAELGRARLLAGVESGRLAGRTRKVYSSILFDFYDYIKGVQVKEKYAGCVVEHMPRPCPMGEYDGLKPFVKSYPPSEDLFLGFLDYKSLKKNSKKRKSADDDDYDSGKRLTTGRVP